MTETRTLMVGVEDPETGDWVEIGKKSKKEPSK